jgi:hypothetical protein
MKHSVIILPRAEFGFQRLYDYITKRSKQGADSWANAFYRALKMLPTQPEALRLAPESKNHNEDIRQLTFKTRQGSHLSSALRNSRRPSAYHTPART